MFRCLAAHPPKGRLGLPPSVLPAPYLQGQVELSVGIGFCVLLTPCHRAEAGLGDHQFTRAKLDAREGGGGRHLRHKPRGRRFEDGGRRGTVRSAAAPAGRALLVTVTLTVAQGNDRALRSRWPGATRHPRLGASRRRLATCRRLRLTGGENPARWQSIFCPPLLFTPHVRFD